jgi:5-(carboxyamino)imidazole ribonucleotide mutase
VIIAGAGGAAHLPGMLASVTPLPVIGVPVLLAHLDGLDSLLSMVQMPAGIPVATVAVGGARNAGLLAVRILAAAQDPQSRALRARLVSFAGQLADQARAKGAALRAESAALRAEGAALRERRLAPPGSGHPFLHDREPASRRAA